MKKSLRVMLPTLIAAPYAVLLLLSFPLATNYGHERNMLLLQIWKQPPEPVSKPAAASKPKPAAQEHRDIPSEHPDVRSDLESELIELLQTKMEKGATLKYLDKKATEWKLLKGGSRVQQMNVDQLQTCINELRST